MKKLLTIAATLGAMTISSQAHAGAAALCIEQETNSSGSLVDTEYFARWGKSPNVDGYIAVRAARRDHRKSYAKSTPYCRHTGDEKYENGGYFVIIKSGREKDNRGEHYNRWAAGFGIDRTMALIDAKKEMSRRDRVWRERTHGYTVAEENEI